MLQPFWHLKKFKILFWYLFSRNSENIENQKIQKSNLVLVSEIQKISKILNFDIKIRLTLVRPTRWIFSSHRLTQGLSLHQNIRWLGAEVGL